jgi:predicted signal transduction protein with EAL and GGDEF domain
VAQGIESRADLNAVRTLGFDQVQGFLVAKPMEARKFARSLLKRSMRIAANEPAADKAPADELSSNVASTSELPETRLPIGLPAQSDANCATIAQTSAGA